MGFFSSLKKSLKLKKISKVLGREFDANETINAFYNKDNEHFDSSKNALEELLDICFEDQTLRKVVELHSWSREDLRNEYHLLEANGCGQWHRGHYITASAFMFGTTLHYVLSTKDKLTIDQRIYRLIEYFAKREMGVVD